LRPAVKAAIITFIISTVAPIIYLKINGDNEYYAQTYAVGKPYSWTDILNLPIYYLLLPLLISLIIFFYKYFTGESIFTEDDVDLYICDKCNNKTEKYQEKCACGGDYVNVDRLKWVDD